MIDVSSHKSFPTSHRNIFISFDTSDLYITMMIDVPPHKNFGLLTKIYLFERMRSQIYTFFSLGTCDLYITMMIDVSPHESFLTSHRNIFFSLGTCDLSIKMMIDVSPHKIFWRLTEIYFLFGHMWSVYYNDDWRVVTQKLVDFSHKYILPCGHMWSLFCNDDWCVFTPKLVDF